MIRTRLRNRLTELTGQIILVESKLREIEEQKEKVLELKNANFIITKGSNNSSATNKDVEFGEALITIGEYGYNLLDTIETWEGEEGLGGIKRNRIQRDIDENYYEPRRMFKSKLEKNKNETKIIWSILQSADMVETMQKYNESYKDSIIAKMCNHKNLPLIENILEDEWNEYLEYLDTIRPEDIHFSSSVENHIETKKDINSKNKVLTKVASLMIHD